MAHFRDGQADRDRHTGLPEVRDIRSVRQDMSRRTVWRHQEED